MPGFNRNSSSAPGTSGPLEDSTAGRSGTFRSVSPAQTLSARFWGFDLCEQLPRVLSNDGVEATRGEPNRVKAFLAQEFPSLTEEALGAAPSATTTEAKRWYLRTACDLIELRHHGRTVGIVIAAPEDWSSYYIRSFAVLHAYQRPGLIRRFIRESLFDPLTAHHVERIAADTSPTNLAMSRLFGELRFHVTGHQLSDRWGPLVRYTKFLDPVCEANFHARFSGATPPGSSRIKKGGRR
jgi:hypothetical protein